MRQSECVRGRTADQFVDAYNALNRKISRIGKVIREKDISELEVIVFYEIPDNEDFVEEPDEPCCYCADCSNYDWGKKCLAGVPKVKPKTAACAFFNIDLGNVTES